MILEYSIHLPPWSSDLVGQEQVVDPRSKPVMKSLIENWGRLEFRDEGIRTNIPTSTISLPKPVFGSRICGGTYRGKGKYNNIVTNWINRVFLEILISLGKSLQASTNPWSTQGIRRRKHRCLEENNELNHVAGKWQREALLAIRGLELCIG